MFICQYARVLTSMEFCIRYGFLLFDHVASQDPLSVSVAILHQFNILPDLYQVGFTKLFFRTGQVRKTIMTTKFLLLLPFFPSFPSCVCTSAGLLIVNTVKFYVDLWAVNLDLTLLPARIITSEYNYCTIKPRIPCWTTFLSLLDSPKFQSPLPHFFFVQFLFCMEL